jgi:hypothetical protein
VSAARSTASRNEPQLGERGHYRMTDVPALVDRAKRLVHAGTPPQFWMFNESSLVAFIDQALRDGAKNVAQLAIKELLWRRQQ